MNLVVLNQAILDLIQWIDDNYPIEFENYVTDADYIHIDNAYDYVMENYKP